MVSSVSPHPRLSIQSLGKSYRSGREQLTVLQEVSLEVGAGETLAVLGPSGSGKTTLLSLAAGLDLPDQGSIQWDQHELTGLPEEERARMRREQAGFIFQSFHLLPSLRAIDNAAVPAELLGWPDARARAKELLARVGLGGRLDHYPSQLSGGEQQRVAVARALVNEPRLLFADEPTGNLDESTGREIADLLFELNTLHQSALILITHDEGLARRCDRILRLREGRGTVSA